MNAPSAKLEAVTNTGNAIRSTCPYCGVGCGVVLRQTEDGFTVEGDKDHPANQGRLCSKGSALMDVIGTDGRLEHPIVDGEQTDWPTAIDETAKRFKAVIDEHGPEAVAIYGSGQLLTEDYYVVNKLMKGFIGVANMDTNSRLCMASTVVGHKRGFGSDTVPGDYTDLEEADLVTLVGSNLAWCHPVLFQRLKAAKEKRGTKIVVIDPRRTDTCDIADMHLAIPPGTDIAIFNALLAHLHESGAIHEEFVTNHVNGFEDALLAAQDTILEDHIADKDLLVQLQQFYHLFTNTPRSVTVFSQGVNQAVDGSDKVNAILNCHLATGRIGTPGCGPFSVTGQPNAMGGREVGGLANTLAAHMDFDEDSVDRVGRFWGSDSVATKPGLKAVDLFDAIHDGKVKAVWVMATNPAVSLPNANKVREALEKCPVVVVSDCVDDTDTQRYAHIRLPAQGWGEKQGTVTNSDRTISRQRRFLDPHKDAKPDWWIVSRVAQKMGFDDAFDFHSAADIFREHAALSAFENNGNRDFDIGQHADISNATYDALTPAKWPLRKDDIGADSTRLFADGGFFSKTGKAQMLPITQQAFPNKTSNDQPLMLNSARYRDHWHTMTRTGLSARLSAHRSEPLLEIHPDDAAQYGIAGGDIVEVSNQYGSYKIRAKISDGQRLGELCLPMHWNDIFAGDAVSGRLFAPLTDPFSGQPASKLVPVSIKRLQPVWFGALVAREQITIDSDDYWVSRPCGEGYVYHLAGFDSDGPARLLAQIAKDGAELLDFKDQTRMGRRVASISEGMLDYCLFTSDSRLRIDIDWLAELPGTPGRMDDDTRRALLAGRAPGAREAKGRIICSCFQVGINSIVNAISQNALTSVDEIGAALSAGTNCGSCIPELKDILKGMSDEKVA